YRPGERDLLGTGEGVPPAAVAEDADQRERLLRYPGEDADPVAERDAGGLGQRRIDRDLVVGRGTAALPQLHQVGGAGPVAPVPGRTADRGHDLAVAAHDPGAV